MRLDTLEIHMDAQMQAARCFLNVVYKAGHDTHGEGHHQCEQWT